MNVNVGQLYIKSQVVEKVTSRQKTNSQGELYDVHTHFTTYLPSPEKRNSFTLTKVKCTDKQLDSLSKGEDINLPVDAKTWKNEGNYGLSLSVAFNYEKSDGDTF
jgi:hypothetical protein